jgi:hypothetical protein
MSQITRPISGGSATRVPVRVVNPTAGVYTWAEATLLHEGVNLVETANIAEAVSLPPATGSGKIVEVHVDTTYFIVVMPYAGQQINRFGVDIGYAQYPRQRIRYIDVKPGIWDFTTNLPFKYPIENAITANVAGTQAAGTYLGMGNNVVRTNTVDYGSVRLPIAVGGCIQILLHNDTDKPVAIFPDTGQRINKLANNAPMYLPPGRTILFEDIGPGPDQWVGGILCEQGPDETVSMGIPLVYAGSGSVAANGALTLTTALVSAYPNAYVYLPNNALAAGAGAGWRYATFSSTTQATVYTDLYTPGAGVVPTIPASPTPVVAAGPGAFVGGAVEIDAFVAGFPAGSLGKNGYLEITEIGTFTNSASAKSMAIRFGAGAGAGQIVSNPSITSQLALTDYRKIVNRGRVDRQVIQGGGSSALGATTNSPAYPSINTGAAFAVYFCLNKVAADNIILEAAAVTKHFAP